MCARQRSRILSSLGQVMEGAGKGPPCGGIPRAALSVSRAEGRWEAHTCRGDAPGAAEVAIEYESPRTLPKDHGAVKSWTGRV